MEKILVLVDVQNVYYTTRQIFRRNFDYNRFWKELTLRGQIEHAFAYAIERGDPKQRQFQNILRAIGFTVKLKPFIQRSDGSAKGDWDVGITVDAMDFAHEVDRIVLVSGDGDFDVLVKRLREKYQIPVEVFGVRELTADSLVNAASHYHSIDERLLL